MPHFISDEDMPLLREVVRRVLQDELGQDYDNRPGPRQAPDVYIAKVPDGGIPALDNDADPPAPGSAECEVYKVNEDTGGAYELEHITALDDKTVLNLATSDIDEGETPFVLIVKTKGGRWVAAAGLGGGEELPNKFVEVLSAPAPGPTRYDVQEYRLTDSLGWEAVDNGITQVIHYRPTLAIVGAKYLAFPVKVHQGGGVYITEYAIDHQSTFVETM